MNRQRKLPIYKLIGYATLIIYAIAAVVFLIFCTTLNMLPAKYIILLLVIMVVIGVLFAWMHEKKVLSALANVLSVVFAVFFVIGCLYIRKTTSTILEVSTAELQTDVVSVYVLKDDPAGSINEAVEYQFGIAASVDRDNTDKTIVSIEKELARSLKVQEYDSLISMMDALKSKEIGAVILNEAFMEIAGDAQGYGWITDGIRKITTVEHYVEAPKASENTNGVPETFIMYLSGIDTYGGVSTRSRSDVNILAVVNTKTKEILLLSTPRDYYVEFSATGGKKDKLTHAGIYGVDVSMDALERLYDIDIDYYLRINFTGFVDVIDALGGIEVYSDYDFTVKNVKSYKAGYNQLTGLEALSFARERYSFEEGDYQRAKNQMEVIRAVIQKCASTSLITNYNSVMNAIAGSFETSISEEQIAALVKMQLSDMAQWKITSYTSSGQSTDAETFSMPGQKLYVINPDKASVEKAKALINGVLQHD